MEVVRVPHRLREHVRNVIRVYLKSGTWRTLRKTILRSLPSESSAVTGMSPMTEALYSSPSAARNLSPQGRVLISALRSGVNYPEQPESTCAGTRTEARAATKADGADVKEA